MYEMRDKGELSEEEFRKARSELFASNQVATPQEPRDGGVIESRYGVAKLMVGFQTVAGYVLLAVGVIALLMGLSSRGLDGLGGIIVGAFFMIGGIVTIGLAQITAAVVDTADYSREIFLLLKTDKKQSENVS